ncbi:MAG: hypothetical protein INR71_03650 [Terriglobus roseus]|nr:hypothetical protein [Terriglobus roseus]
MEMWKDLLEAETARREQADEDALKLRDEIRQLKMQLTQRPASAGQASAHPTRHAYNFGKRQQFGYNGMLPAADSRAVDSLSAAGGLLGDLPVEENGAVRPSTANGSLAASSVTMIEQLKHENAELRRDLGAQTSMLTSRNRERERLQQEIEDLKLHSRRAAAGLGGQSVAGDSIFERSVSRQGHVRQGHDHGHARSASRLSAGTRGNGTLAEDAMSEFEREREEWEQKISAVRDDLATTKLLNQDLERELNAHLDILTRVEEENKKFLEERDALVEDLQGLQAERDEVLLGLEDKENEVTSLRDEALDRIEELEDAIAQKQEELQNLNTALDSKTADFQELQAEMRAVSESLVALEDDAASKRRKITSLEGDLQAGEREIEELEKRIGEHVAKNERLEVQLESTQSEVAFLREEQEGDKIKIGELEASLTQAQQAYQEEKERLEEERRQREVVIEGEKDEVQKMVAELNSQLGKARDEVRKLRKNLSSKEVEAQQWKDRLDALEGGLKEALGDINGTRSSFLNVSCCAIFSVQLKLTSL